MKLHPYRHNFGCSRLAGLVVLAAIGAGCSRLGVRSGESLAHSYRGVPDNDLSVTPDPSRPPPQARTIAPRTSAPSGGSAAGAAAFAGSAQQPAPLPIEPVWTTGGAPEVRKVNIYGEIDGMSLPIATTTGDAGFQQHTFTDEGGDAAVVVDPSGKWMAFASTRHSERSDIYLQRVDGTSVTQLTSDAADDHYPSFSPDGRQIAFASTRAGSWQIYVMDTDGRNVVQVTNSNMQAIHPSFSPDGSRLIYCALGSRSGQWELWTADLHTGEKRMIGYGLFPTWSPDKTVERIAYQRARQRGGRWFSLWTLDLIEGEGRRMTEVVASTNAAIVSPRWSPDGKRLAFAAVVDDAAKRANGAEKSETKESAAWGRQDIWTVNADGSNRQRLTDGNGANLSPYWSPDNRVYFISDRGGMECVWSVRVDSARLIDVARTQQPPPPVDGQPVKGGEIFADPRDPGDR